MIPFYVLVILVASICVLLIALVWLPRRRPRRVLPRLDDLVNDVAQENVQRVLRSEGPAITGYPRPKPGPNWPAKPKPRKRP